MRTCGRGGGGGGGGPADGGIPGVNGYRRPPRGGHGQVVADCCQALPVGASNDGGSRDFGSVSNVGALRQRREREGRSSRVRLAGGHAMGSGCQGCERDNLEQHGVLI